jgi:hypothetical protein
MTRGFLPEARVPLVSNNTQIWRTRAAEARILAEHMDGEAKLAMLQVVAGYDRLVRVAEECDRARKPVDLYQR